MTDSSSRAYVALPGSERQLVPGAQAVGPSDPTEVIEVTIRVRSRAPSGQLEALVDALGATPPAERTYLTPEQFTATYGADPAEMEQVAQFAREQQLTIVRTDLAQRTIVVSGTAQLISAAFRVQLEQYTSPRGPYRGRLGPVQIPAELKDIIEGVFGLDNRLQAHPHIILPDRAARLRTASGSLASGQAQAATSQSFAPPQVGAFYDFPTNLTGAGQCIGLLEFGGGFSQSDLDAYFQQLGLPVPQVTAVAVDGVANEPGKDTDADGEVLLDIEVASSLAPGAKIVVYFAPFTEQGWVDAVGTAVHDTKNRPSVLSISWGFTEGQDIWTTQAIQSVNQAFQAAALQGMTVCCASGDDGSQDELADGQAHVDFPAASPYVLACGGTSLTVSGTSLVGETVWNNGERQSGGGASGGGISDMNALPSWQQSIVPPSVNPDHHVGRGVPDVAGNADEQSGYTILVDGQEISGVGGTSAVAPLWAALIARINQQLGKPVGFINPLLYTAVGGSDAFRDVTTGNNDPTGGRLGGYAAQPGWDACTGWGSPNGARLLTALTAGAAGTGGATAPAGGATPAPSGTPAPSSTPAPAGAPAGAPVAPPVGNVDTGGSASPVLVGAVLLVILVAAAILLLTTNTIHLGG
jgi:kumamolisin